MRTPTTFDSRYLTHTRRTLNGFMFARAEVYKPTGERTQWTPGTGNTDNALALVWVGPARVQPNIDWRARARDFAGEFDATMAVRVNIPMHQNEHGAVLDENNQIVSYAMDPVFALGDVVIITEVNGQGQQTLLNKRFTVRNALPSTNSWEHDLLCDSGTSAHG